MSKDKKCYERADFDPPLTTYHDQEWGMPVHDDRPAYYLKCSTWRVRKPGLAVVLPVNPGRTASWSDGLVGLS